MNDMICGDIIYGVIIKKREHPFDMKHKYTIFARDWLNGWKKIFKQWEWDTYEYGDIYSSHKVGVIVKILVIDKKFLFFKWKKCIVIEWGV